MTTDGTHRESDVPDVGDQNVERLLSVAYDPEVPDEAFVRGVRQRMLLAAERRGKRRHATKPALAVLRGLRLWPAGARMLACAAAAVVLIGLGVLLSEAIKGPRPAAPVLSGAWPTRPTAPVAAAVVARQLLGDGGLTARPRPAAPAPKPVAVGSRIETKANQRRRVALPDGSVAYLNRGSELRVISARGVSLARGEVFVEVARPRPGGRERFVLATPDRRITALGTKFAVRTDAGRTDVLVTQGKVRVSGYDGLVHAGRQLSCGRWAGGEKLTAAPRASHALAWTKDLMAAGSPLVPGSDYAGGALVCLDPDGQESRLSLRKYHVDVHVEDGFARTTIDQTYFNHMNRRLEGTFYFPLPPDASISRLAMYVNGKLMEGGMAERGHARYVFEDIMHTRRDPALLEWVDGTTFKMRVFPLEGRQEKRIVLSYVQKLPTLYGRTEYRFAGGHSMELVGQWSFRARVAGGAELKWESPTHKLQATKKGGDLLLDVKAKQVMPDEDVVLHVHETDPGVQAMDFARFSTAGHEKHRYLMLRYRPELGEPVAAAEQADPQEWAFLFEASGDRDPLLARAQIDILKAMLERLEPADRFTVLAAGTHVRALGESPQPVTAENIAAAVEFLEKAHLVGALDLEGALAAAGDALTDFQGANLVHLGTGIAVLGKRETNELVKLIPAGVRYVGVGVGKRWSRGFMAEAAAQTGGYFTQINPDENVPFRAFELVSTLRTPRLMKVTVTDPAGKWRFLTFGDSLAEGEELCAVARLGEAEPLPAMVTIAATLDGKAWSREIPVEAAAEGADYLPRFWAKLEIDRLLAGDVKTNRDKIIALSKAMYVMSPFTSLLVLENEAMYKQYKVDRGRKDHWALYPAPGQIKVVHEPDPRWTGRRPAKDPKDKGKKPSADEVLKTILVRIPPPLFASQGIRQQYGGHALTAWHLYSGAYAVPYDYSYSGSGRININTAPRLVIYSGSLPFRVKTLGVSGGGSGGGLLGLGGTLLDVSGTLAMDRRFVTLSLIPDQGGGDEKRARSIPLMNAEATRVARDIELMFGRRRTRGSPMSLRGGRGWGGEVRALARPSRLRAPRQVSNIDLDLVVGVPNLAGPMINLKKAWSGRRGIPFSVRNGVLYADGHVSWEGDGDAYSDWNGRWLVDVDGDPMSWGMPTTRPARMKRLLVSLDEERGEELGWLIRRLEAGAAPNVLYRRPSFTGDHRIFCDLLSYAPGMNTSAADVAAVLEAEARADKRAAAGKIDPAAKALIDKARKAGWQSVVIPDAKGKAVLTVTFDGAGRLAYRRRTWTGLDERVICDGATLWHLYDEIGMGARRKISRFHRAGLARLVPWFVLPAEDLARGVNLLHVGPRTVAISPVGAEDAKDEKGKPVKYARLHLIFAADGRLAERRLVEMPSGKTLARQTYAADGTVTWLDAEDKVLAKVELTVSPAAAPDLTPDVKKLVVLPMPFRTRQQVIASRKIRDAGKYEALSADDALALLGADLCQSNWQVQRLIGRRFFALGDRRVGFYTLLLASPRWNYTAAEIDVGSGVKVRFDPVKDHPGSPLAKYIAQQTTYRRTGDQKACTTIDDSRGGFVEQLASLRLVNHGLASTKAGRKRAVGFVNQYRPSLFGWAILCRISNYADGREFCRAVAKAAQKFEDARGLGYHARYEAARALASAGDWDKARGLFEKLYADALRWGVLPPIESQFRNAILTGGAKGRQRWTALMRETSAGLIAKQALPAAVVLAWQCHQLGDRSLAEDLLAAALAEAKGDSRLPATLTAIQFLHHTGQHPRADAIIEPLLKDEQLSGYASLWRLGALLAQRRGRLASSLARLERAMEIHYGDLPEVINVRAVRVDYGALLGRYEQLAQAIATLEKRPPAGLLRRIIRAADRWRALDPDDTAACQSAAKILQALGARELAWEYLTTPLATKPNEAAPWSNLARTLKQQGELDLAQRAYASAFDAERTNAQILWERARLLQRLGRGEQARKLYRQIAEGTWPRQFNGVRAQARNYLGLR